MTGFSKGEDKENIPQNEELIFLDPKKCRTQEELGQNQNNDAELDLTGNIEASPKKDYVARVPTLGPAKDYESVKLELPWTWEPTDCPIPS